MCGSVQAIISGSDGKIQYFTAIRLGLYFTLCLKDITFDFKCKLRKMNMRILFTVFLICSVHLLWAQGFGSVFRAGLATSTFRGDVLTAADGSVQEQLGYVSGFHLGAGMRYKFDYAEQFGMNVEVVYTQKGGRVRYDGPSYFVFRNTEGRREVVNGERNYIVDISTSHFDLPITFFARFLKKLEVSGGIYLSAMLRADGGGSYTFRSSSPFNVDMTVFLDQNYRRDNVADYSAPFGGETIPVRLGAELYPIPKTQGAYFEHTEKRGSLIQGFDMGLTGGLSYYFTKGLYLGGRIQYGLLNQFNPEMFVSLRDLDNNQPALRSDTRQNLSFQIAIGFAF
jgi:hypothetical protein